MATLVRTTAGAQLTAVRELFAEYAGAVAEPCCFAGFERELAGLPHGYVALFLALEDGAAAGCVGIRKLDAETAEMKRLYVRPAYRGRGIGRALAEATLALARQGGYTRMVLDSLPKMHSALELYRGLAFRETVPYLDAPTPGARCFELRL
jgi:putative acetyltransferase